MESNARGPKALLTGIGVLAALVVVAVASRGSTASGGGGASRPANLLVDLLLTFYVLALVAGAVLFLYLLAINRGAGGAEQSRRSWQNWLGMLVIVSAALLLARDFGGRRIPLRQPAEQGGGGSARVVPPDSAGETYEAQFAWIPVLVTLALIGIALFAAWLARRSRRRARGETGGHALADAIAEAVDESLDDLRAEPDPRRAVIAAYARLERVLAAYGLPRRPSEAPLEYLARMLAGLAVGPPAARRLTELFERARFSHHAVGPEMKQQAIAALEDVRDDLAAARALAEQERAAALKALRERTAR